MKKIVSLFLAVFMVFSVFFALPFTVSAVDKDVLETSETSGDYKYRVLDGTAEITGYTGSATTLNIPSVLDEYRVTSIGMESFLVVQASRQFQSLMV